MNLLHCWLCEANLIWGGEQDLKDNEDYHVVTNLSCPNCNSLVHIYHPKPKMMRMKKFNNYFDEIFRTSKKI